VTSSTSERAVGTQTVRPDYDPVSISPLSFWASTAEVREESFKILRDERPVSWHPPLEGSLMTPEQDGFWAVTRHADVVAVSRDPELFCSGQGVMMEEVPEDILEAAQSFLAMDAPNHTAMRRLINAAFTPKQVARIEEGITARAARIVDDLLQVQEGDFVEQVSKRLPMWTIFEMLGLESEHREEAALHADEMVSWADEAIAAGREPGEVLNDGLVGLISLGFEMAASRRARPQDDLMTNLVEAEVDGQRLTDEQIASFFVLLSVAGNDTTRNSISFTMKALCDFPDQRKLLTERSGELLTPAVSEFVRFATPVMTFRRTATRDLEMHGAHIRQGDWVVMVYSSANRDERVFENPDVFDVERAPNNQLAFGGGGPHFCMGHVLARTQLRALFDELLRKAPHLQVGDPTYLVGNFVRAIPSMPYQLQPG
jgi:cytochrome P450